MKAVLRIACSVVLTTLLASAAVEAADHWELFDTKSFPGASEISLVAARALDRIIVSAAFPERPEDNRMVCYSDKGSTLWEFRPHARSKVRAEGISDDGRIVLGLVVRQETATAGDTGIPPKSLVILDGSDGQVRQQVALLDSDWGARISRDATTLLVRGMTPRLLGPAGQLLLDITSVAPALPNNWMNQTILLSPDGSYVLMLANDDATDLYQVTATGKRYWQAHALQGTWSTRLVPPQMSSSGQYLLATGMPVQRVAEFTPLTSTGLAPLHTPRRQIVGSGWSMALFAVKREAASGVAGGIGDMLWGDMRVHGNSDPVDGPSPHHVLLDAAMLEAKARLWVAAVTPADILVQEVDYAGNWIGERRIALPEGADRALISLAGDPPLMLIAYQKQGSAVFQARLLDRSGKVLFTTGGDGRPTRVLLSSNAQRAIILTSKALYSIRRRA